MSKQSIRDEMVVELARFWNSDSRQDEHYEQFVFVFFSVCEMADTKLVGWIADFTERGYEKIELAYNELLALGWGKEDDDLF
jgi:hypothetical protein